MGNPQQDNKERLLDVATDLFSSKGFKGTSIRDIASEMGMSISNLYHHYKNKDALLLAIIERTSLTIVKTLRELSKKDLEPYSKFKLLLKTHINLCAKYFKESKIFLLDEENLSPEGVEKNLRIQREVFEIYLNELKELKKVGIVKGDNLSVLAFNVLGVINWQLRWYRPEGRLSLAKVTDEIVSFVLYGVTGSEDVSIVQK
jgi:AcrR family transcriptional regulator